MDTMDAVESPIEEQTTLARNLKKPEGESATDFRLGLDLRIASEAVEATYLVDAFMAQYKQVNEVSSLQPIPIALTHAHREWTGHVRHASTEKELTRWTFAPSLWNRNWESEFTQKSHLNLWHQFAPVDKIRIGSHCPNLITVLPAHKKEPHRSRIGKNTAFIVPSHEDAASIRNLFRADPQRVHVVRPTVRPFLFNVPVHRDITDGWFLFLVGKKQDIPRVEKWIQILAGRYPKMARKLVALETDTISLKEENWLKLLQHTKVCFYFSQSKYDWAVPAMEAMYSRIPTVFLDECHAISELLPKFPLSLPRFLIDSPDPSELTEHADEAFSLLKDAGVFEKNRLVESTFDIYQSLSGNSPRGQA